MRKLLCAMLCVLVLSVVSANAECYEGVEISDPYYAFTAPDGTRDVADLAGLCLRAETALHRVQEQNAVAGNLLVSVLGEDALRVTLEMTEDASYVRFNEMNGRLALGKSLLLDFLAGTLNRTDFDLPQTLSDLGLTVTDRGDGVVMLEDGAYKGHAYSVAPETEDLSSTIFALTGSVLQGKRYTLIMLESGSFRMENADNPGNYLLWNVAETGVGYAVHAFASGSARYDGWADETHPDMLRGTVRVFDKNGKMRSDVYACFGPEETERGLATTLQVMTDAVCIYAEMREGTFFISAVPADGSVWTLRGEDGLLKIAAQQNGSRDFIRANFSIDSDANAQRLPLLDLESLPGVSGNDEQIVDAGWRLKEKLERIEALRPLLQKWIIPENND